MSRHTIRCHPGIGGKVEGVALVTGDNFSARYDLDRIEGIFSRPSHDLAGQSYVGKILVCNNAKGGVASAWMLGEMASRDMAPLAMVFNRVNPIMAQGAAFADMVLVDRAEVDVTSAIRTGDRLTIDAAAGTIEIERDE